MKRVFLLFFYSLLLLNEVSFSQVVGSKYPSILWEITKKGTPKPSYLIGTMHVSNKMAFNLPDSFYMAINNSQVVALETNPETWQEDMSKYNIDEVDYSGVSNDINSEIPDDYLTISTLKFYRYNNKIEKSLYSNPATINNLLYRTYGNESSDFEEDTYLDMYIFQCGKKRGKKVTGVENYAESMKLMEEAYSDAAKEKNKKERSYGDIDQDYSTDKLQEAYRKGNLDLLDSINKYNSFSAAFDEKFLYKRNEIQANSIDSILTSGSILFVGVGAAHLPGDRGVIELLRKKGYKLRPIKMGERASREKDIIDKIRVPVTFQTEKADDGLFTVDIPGKFFQQDPTENYENNSGLDQKHYADMANGSFYMVTRIMTNAWMWNHTEKDVYKTLDSLLYENVPGKIISKISIEKNGYKGFDIVNRTRRGDLQRYNIFITPFEIIFFKLGGNGDYIKNGEEAKKFFGSIRFNDYKNLTDTNFLVRKKFTPAYGGFAVDFPHEPYIGNDGSWIFDAADKTGGINYRVIRTDINNFRFVEEDTFDLGLMDESFRASEFIDTQLYRNQIQQSGYPALECKYRDKSGAIYLTRFIIQGPHYYTVIAHGKQEKTAMRSFLNSFEIKPFEYGGTQLHKDSMLYYSVKTPYYPVEKKIKLNMPQYNDFGGYGEAEEPEPEAALLEGGVMRSKVISNDTTGEKIFITFNRASNYYYSKDSATIFSDRTVSYMGDTTWIVRSKKISVLPDNWRVIETAISDTGSSRALWNRTFYKDGNGFSLLTQTDTLSKPSLFVSNFFETFSPSDSLKWTNPFTKKSTLFFKDFNSQDSVLRRRAMKHINKIVLDSSDLNQLKQVILTLRWEEKNYLKVKKLLIDKLGEIKTNSSADFLKQMYYSLEDTVQLQYPVLENLLQHKTIYAYEIFREIIKSEPPVLELGENEDVNYEDFNLNLFSSQDYKFDDGKFLDELSDSLQLTKSILPDLLPLLNLEDYKNSIMSLLGQLADSNLLLPGDYDMYLNKFLIEARQELKKQSIAEKKKSIEKAAVSKSEKKLFNYDYDEKGEGNNNLSLYAKVLIPFWETNSSVPRLLLQMLNSNDKRLKYSTMMLLLQKGKPFTDTLINYFAALDEYRYELYRGLRTMKKSDKFPGKYNNHLDLGRSMLLDKKSYSKPDTLAYVNFLKTEFKGKKGLVYFYKYKEKKDDLNWKLAIVGLVPENTREFEFEDSASTAASRYAYKLLSISKYNRFSFTQFTDVRLLDNIDINGQLVKELKKVLYARRKSASRFYEDDYKGALKNTEYID